MSLANSRGYNARRWLCRGESQNPYPAGSIEAVEWLEGFRRGARDDGAAQDADAAREVGRYGEGEEEPGEDPEP